MRLSTFISTRLLAFAIGVQVFNISLNQNDYMLGKTGNGFVYINEIETVVEFIAEVCITGKDVIPETQVPGGSLGFEEEEKQLIEKPISIVTAHAPVEIFNDLFSPYHFNVKAHSGEVSTPPPQA